MKHHRTLSTYNFKSLTGHLVAIETQSLQGNRAENRGLGFFFYIFLLVFWLNDLGLEKRKVETKGLKNRWLQWPLDVAVELSCAVFLSVVRLWFNLFFYRTICALCGWPENNRYGLAANCLDYYYFALLKCFSSNMAMTSRSIRHSIVTSLSDSFTYQQKVNILRLMAVKGGQ